MKLYNTLTRKLETFRPQDPQNVKIYTCGPTVYSYQHIGNYAAYIYWDLLVRTLTANGYKVNRILNLTDVGHLSSDADEGEDKLEKGARRERKTVWEIAEFYAQDFLQNFHALNLVEPAQITHATDFIEQDLALVDRLTDKGYTYETTDGIYFDTSKFAKYPDFAHLDLDHLHAGARVALSSEKQNNADFAVWKFIQPGEDHAMRWDYRGRSGYPGWHLECSTIIHSVLGEPIDIHTGGIDHIPVHHTNEIAQSETAFDKPLARYWLHCNFLTVGGEKISKSLGNVYTFVDLERRGFSHMDFKMWVLQGHYQSERNFTFEGLAAAQSRRLAWRNRIARAYQEETETTRSGTLEPLAFDPKPETDSVVRPDVAAEQFGAIKSTNFYPLAALNDNLNSAAAFAAIDEHDLTLRDWQLVDELLGLNLLADSPRITPATAELIDQREAARATKDYAAADRLRDQLAEQNITVLDTVDGPIWQYLM